MGKGNTKALRRLKEWSNSKLKENLGEGGKVDGLGMEG